MYITSSVPAYNTSYICDIHVLDLQRLISKLDKRTDIKRTKTPQKTQFKFFKRVIGDKNISPPPNNAPAWTLNAEFRTESATSTPSTTEPKTPILPSDEGKQYLLRYYFYS